MNNEIKYKNDIFVATLSNPNAGLLELLQSDINSSNTGLLSPDEYKSSKLVKDTFTDDKGIFNQTAFDNAYLLAANKYKDLTDEDVYKRVEKELEYSPDSRFKPLDAKTFDVNPNLSIVKNPTEQLSGITSLFGKTPSTKSIRELAQNNKIFDTKTNTWKKETPNDLGLLGSIFSEPLVYAQWDEDGMHIDKETNREILHKKGEYKVDDNGKYFTETLGDREIYGKQAVASSDLLTKEGTWLNKIDFFDSDGLNKSAWGTTFKIAAQVTPYLIPGFNKIWGGLSATFGMASVLPTFYKAMDGILTGNEALTEQNSLWKGATNAENWFSKFNSSFSDSAQGGLANYEQMGSLVSDIFSQIYQQRAAASVSKWFKNTDLTKAEKELIQNYTAKYAEDFIGASKKGLVKNPKEFYQQMINLNPELKAISKRQSKLAKQLSLGYMALTTTGDIYGDALQHGYDRRTAGIASLAAAAGQYGIMMNNDLGSWFLDKTTGYNDKINRGLMKKALRPYYDEFEKAVSQINVDKVAGKVSLQKGLFSAKNSINKVFNNIKDGTESFWGNAGIESIEEVTEEAVLDATKGIVDTFSWLGFTKKQGSFDTLQNVFSKQGLERYMTSAIGGFVGGALFEANTKFIEPALSGQKIQPEEKASLIREIANGNTEQLLKEAEKFRKLGNSKLSPVLTTINGEEINLSVTEGKSQADIVADNLINYIKYVDGILNQEDLKLSDDQIFEKALLNEVAIPILEESGIHKIVLSDFNNQVKELVEIRSKIDSIPEDKKEDRSKLESELLEKRNELQSLLNGERYEDYLSQTLFYLIKPIHEPFSSLDIDSFSKHHFGESYYNLSETGEGLSKLTVKKAYDDFVETKDVKTYLSTMTKAFKDLQEKFSSSIKEYSTSKYGDSRKQVFEKLINTLGMQSMPLIVNSPEGKKLFKDISDSSIKGGGENLSLEGLFNIKPSEYLISNNIIDLSNFDETSHETVLNLIDTQLKDLPLDKWNTETLQQVLSNVITLIQNEENKTSLEKGIEPNIVPNIEIINNLDSINFNKDFLLKSLNGESEIDGELLRTVKTYIDNEDIPQFLKQVDSLLTTTSKVDLFEGETISDILENELELDNINTIVKEGFDSGKKINEILTEIKNNISERLLEKGNQSSIESNDPNQLIQYQELINEITKVFNSISISENLKNYEQLLTKNVKNNPLYDFLRKLELTIDKDVSKSIFDILQEESKLLKGLSSIDNYIRQGYNYDSIVKGLNTLKMAKGIIYGMETSEINFNNPFGFNQSIKHYLEKYQGGKNADKYQELNTEESYLLNKELDLLISKLEFLKNLSDSNSISKADEQKKSRENFNSILLNKIEKTNLSLGGKFLTDGIETIMSQQISDEEKLQKIEVLMFENFEDAIKERSIEEVLEKIFTEFNFEDILQMNSFGISPEIDKISDYDLMIYILTSISHRSDIFNLRLKNIISNENFNKAPFFGQEYAAKIGFGLYKKPELFSAMRKVLYKQSKDEYHKQIFGDGSNIFFLNGISGGGKTSTSGQYILKMILEDNKDSKVLITAPGKRQIDTIETALKSSMTQDEISKFKLETKSRKELFDMFLEPTKDGNSVFDILTNSISSVAKDRKFIKLSEVKQSENSNGVGVLHLDDSEIKFNEKLKVSKDKPKVIFIDETTHFNKIEQELLNRIAKEFNLSIISFGDSYQKGAQINIGSSSNEVHIDQMWTVNAPKLKISVRPANIHQKDNALVLENLLDQLNMISVGKTINERIPLEQDKLKLITPEIKYYQSESDLHGTKIVEDLNDNDLKLLKNALLKSREIKPTAKLGILTGDGLLDDSLKAKLEEQGFTPDMYKVYGLGSYVENAVQGAEEEYFIIKDVKPNNLPSDNLKSLYTYSGRALTGSIIVDSYNTFSNLGIKNKKESTTNEYKLDDNIIKTVTEERLKVLDVLTKDVKIDTTKKIELKQNDLVEEEEDEFNTIDVETTTDLISEIINSKKDDITTGPIEYQESEGTPFHYMGHLFYNHIGIIEDLEKGKYKIPNTKNKFGLNILNQKAGTLVKEKYVTAFIRLKNLLSLHDKNSKSFIDAIKSDGEIIEFLKNTNLDINTNLSDDKFINEFLESNALGNIVLVAKRFNRNYDYPAMKQNLKDDEVLNDNDIFLNIAIEFKEKDGNVSYITIASLPKLTTLSKKFDNTTDTYNKYNELINKVSSIIPENDFNSVTTFEIKDNPKSNLNRRNINDKLPIFDFLTGLRIENNNEGFYDLPELHKMGMIIQSEDMGIISDDGVGNDKEFFKLLKEYRENNEDLTDEQKSNLLDSKGRLKARGRAYVIVGFANRTQKELQKLIILTPKVNSFKELYSLYKENSPSKGDTIEKKYARKTLFSKSDQLRLLFSIKEGLSGNNTITFEKYLDSFKNYIRKVAEKDKSGYYLSFIEILDNFSKYTENGKTYDDYINETSILKDSYKTINGLGEMILGHLFKLERNTSPELVEKNTKIFETIKEILSNPNGLMKNQFYINPAPIKTLAKDKTVKLSLDFLNKFFTTNSVIEMPRILINLEKTIDDVLNSDIVIEEKVIEEPLEKETNVNDEITKLKNDKINELNSIINSSDISNESKNELKNSIQLLSNLNITSNGEGETIFIDGDNDYSSDLQDKLLEDVAMITLTEKEIPEIENYINKLFC